MDLKQQLTADLKEAMRNGDKRRKLAIRAVRAAITNAEVLPAPSAWTGETGERRRSLDEDEIIALIAKEVKQRRDSIAQFRKGGREDLVAQEQAEIEALEKYLPRQLSAEEIREEARKVIAEVEASGPGDMGRVMGALMPSMRGRAEGRLVSQIVRELLTE
ncbi:MAG: GatB/YqeY domain-containing protein [Chloroflexota bacterium]|nr:GatB/YqeY domain-containing protein [Chloroflexota bacterium]